MKKVILITVLCLLCFFKIFSAERTKPIHLFIAIDTSLSMDQSKVFEDMKTWLKDTFLSKYLITGDSIKIYSFCGEIKEITNLKISSESDIQTIINQIETLKPNGAYTDIGTMLDKLHSDVLSLTDSAKSFTLICTDLIQEAPYGSKYVGTYYDFADKYLASDRVIEHKTNNNSSWYEINVRTTSDETIVQIAEKLYTTSATTSENPLYKAE